MYGLSCYRKVAVDSIVSSLSDGVVDIQLKGSATSWEQVRSKLVIAGLFLLCAVIGMGNSKWHKVGVSVGTRNAINQSINHNDTRVFAC